MERRVYATDRLLRFGDVGPWVAGTMGLWDDKIVMILDDVYVVYGIGTCYDEILHVSLNTRFLD